MYFIEKYNNIICGFITGSIFTSISHPFHVVYIKYNRMIINNTIKPNLINSLYFLKKTFKNEGIKNLTKGIHIRTIQGGISYGIIYYLKNILNNIQNKDTKKYINFNSGFIENIVFRQFMNTYLTSKINNDNIKNYNTLRNTFYILPITSIIRGCYFTSSMIGKDIGKKVSKDNKIIQGVSGCLLSLPFISFNEIITNSINNQKNIKETIIRANEGIKNSYKDVSLVLREFIFLFPFIYSDEFQNIYDNKVKYFI